MSKKKSLKTTPSEPEQEPVIDSAPTPPKGKRFPLSNVLLVYRKLYKSTYSLNKHPIHLASGKTKEVLIKRANLQLQQISEAFNLILEKAVSDTPPKTAIVPSVISEQYLDILKQKPAVLMDTTPLKHVSF